MKNSLKIYVGRGTERMLTREITIEVVRGTVLILKIGICCGL